MSLSSPTLRRAARTGPVMRVRAAAILLLLLVEGSLSGAAVAANTAPTAKGPAVANPFPIPRTCLTYPYVWSALVRQGFRGIRRIHTPEKNWVMRATHDNWQYELVVNKCPAAILGAQRVQ